MGAYNYSTIGFTNGNRLSAEQLNKMDTQISSLSRWIDSNSNVTTEINNIKNTYSIASMNEIKAMLGI